MKNLITLLLLLIIVITINQSCSNEKSAEVCEKPVNPNGDSELALLMREMATHVDNEKIKLAKGEMPSAYPEAFEKIKTAKPTDSMSKSEHFDNFADQYVSAVKYYAAATDLEKSKTAFNNMVSTCISCHNVQCPGPLKRIEKMYLN